VQNKFNVALDVGILIILPLIPSRSAPALI
jgi:hypothetical protein